MHSGEAFPGLRTMPRVDEGRVTIPQRVVLAAIRGYQRLFSQQYAGACRFLPSCSEYAAEAVTRHGAARGSLLAVRRLARCHPLGTPGHDPVPPTQL